MNFYFLKNKIEIVKFRNNSIILNYSQYWMIRMYLHHLDISVERQGQIEIIFTSKNIFVETTFGMKTFNFNFFLVKITIKIC